MNAYDHLHEDLACGMNYYQIKRVDFYGNVSYSPVRSLMIDEASAIDAIQFFPNPTIDVVNISRISTCGFDEDATVTIYAANGDLISELVIRRSTTKAHRIDMSQYPTGVYMARVVFSTGETKTVRLTKISSK